jgi:phosphoglycerate dehydrogenase-like enzyme
VKALDRKLVKVLYVSPERLLDPCYYDFVAAAGAAVSSSVMEPEAPVGTQFDGVEVVVEQAGGYSTNEMWDAAAAAEVKLWQLTCTGVDNIEVASFQQRGIPLACMRGPGAIPMAEHALTLMLAVAKELGVSRRNLDSRRFGRPMTSELFGKTLGLVGVGASGRELARRCSALGMRVVGVDRVEVPRAVQEGLGIEFVGGPDRLDWLLQEADYLSLHVPLNTTTRGLIDRRRLSLMKPGATLVNVARGALVDEDALAEALREGRLAGAGLDVFSDEPFDVDHPLLQLDNVIATPHNGAITREQSVRHAEVILEQVDRVAQGLPPLHLVTDAAP